MQIPLELTLRDIPHSEAVEARIREKAAKLDRFFGRIMSCRVTVESPQRHKHNGKLYSVHIDLTLPGRGELVVNRVQDEDVYVAIRDAFNAAVRQLEDHAQRVRGEVKQHDTASTGVVARLNPAQGYGFIETRDGREIYFHANSVGHGEFPNLDIGHEVMFVEEQGDKGPQARMVTVGKHHVPD